MCIIFPLREKIGQTVFMQQRPRFTGGRKIGLGNSRFPGVAPALPWDDGDRPPVLNYGIVDKPPIMADIIDIFFGLCALGIQPINKAVILRPQKGILGGQPAVVHSLKVMPTEVFGIIGVSKNNLGAPLANCTMSLFRLDRDSGNNIVYTFVSTTISDSSGNYFFAVNKNSMYFVKAINAGATVFGVSNENLTGVLS
jgi:hypothetical protein